MKFALPLLACLALLPTTAPAQNVRSEMERADRCGREAAKLVIQPDVRPYWPTVGGPFVYRLTTAPAQHEYRQVNLQTGEKSPAFDRAALAKALAAVATKDVGAENLPLDDLQLPADGGAIRFRAFGKGWAFTPADPRVVPDDTPPSPTPLMPPDAAMRGTRDHGPPDQSADRSPDGKWQAAIRDHNLAIVPTAGGEPTALTTDGTAADGYSPPFHWAPNSTKLIAWRAKEVETRQIHLVQSSPPDQVQPKLLTIDYPKPGDPIRQPKPRLFDLATKRQLPVADTLFDTPWELSHAAWAADSTEFSFVYNQRGHQLLRIVAISGDTGTTRTILEERSETFIDYSQKTYLHRLPQTRSLIWASERSGTNHLYRVNEVSGEITPITTGDWNVREVVRVDEDQQRLLLKINGQPGSDPYYEQFAWVNFDGSHFTRLTPADGTHRIELSPDKKWLIDTWSRVDQAPVVELRRATDGTLITELARADDAALRRQGWQCPERFVAKGRDGQTDIYGIILRPSNFDPAKKYPVVEQIYAGPHNFFVPKAFFAHNHMRSMAELGFIVVSIDGMGTNWRSKKFHDGCWKNLADSGFPDRVAWIKVAAATRPEMDLTRVGIFGGSAGGQSTLAGLLHHGDFYHVGVADCGCHDNRMDKIWWNEAWMGWPVDASYAANSNVTHAAKLTGRLLLIVGELDHNVDPASTAQVIAALEKAGKDSDYLPIMNSDHGAAESPYGSYRRSQFLIRHLRDQAPQ